MKDSRRFKSEAVTREQLEAIDSMHVPSHCITNNGQVYALAYGSTSAKRIANALNIYQPKRRKRWPSFHPEEAICIPCLSGKHRECQETAEHKCRCGMRGLHA